MGNTFTSETEFEKGPDDDVFDAAFQGLSYSRAQLAKKIFKGQPETASKFFLMSHSLKTANLNAMCVLVETLRKPPLELPKNVLEEAENMLLDLENAGFKLGWLKKKVEEVCLKKKKIEASDARIRKLEGQTKNLRMVLRELEAELKYEEDVSVAARDPLDFNDVFDSIY